MQEAKSSAAVGLEPHIFREYDIRGIVGVDLDEAIASSVGTAYAGALRDSTGTERPRVAVGFDNRPSSPALARGLIEGLRKGGADVVDVGLAPTPLVYWAESTLGTQGAIMITGSHNPPEWNGIKMTMSEKALYGAEIQGLLERIRSGKQTGPGSGPSDAGDPAAGRGSVEEQPIIARYIEDVRRRFSLSRPVKVAVDCGNGTGSLVAVPLLEALGAEVLPLYCESDGTFPNHHPDPTVDENLVDLIELVRAEECELGIALDGDADRLGAVDENGDVVRGDLLLLLFGLDILERGRGSTMVFDVKCSQVLPEVYGKAGGTPVMWKTGHSLIKEKMREIGAPIAGELSGHIMFADDYLGFDDALYDACRLVDLLAGSDRSLSEMAGAFPRYVSTPELRIEVTEASKVPLVKAAQEHFRQEHEVIEVDGARILFGDGWGLLRASNTQPVLVARFEARTHDRLREIREEVEGWLKSQGVDVQE